jgi:PAS domain S-box-containing protein
MTVADTVTALDAIARAGGPARATGTDAPDPRVFQLVRAAAHAADCQIAVFYQGSGPEFEAVADFGAAGPPGVLRFGGAPDADDAEDALAAAAAASLAGCGGAPLPFVAAARVAPDGDGATRGVLVVADTRAARTGLSAAQFYVLRAHAAQLAALIELQELRRVASAALAGAERLRLLESVAVHANDAILITGAEPIDLPGPRILYCNAAFTRTTGYAEAEILGRTPRLLQGPGTDRAALDKLRGALSRWEPVVVELLNYRKDGATFWVELSIVPVADETGWFTHWVSVQRDVSDRKTAEEAATRARVAEAEREALQAEISERRRVEERQTLLTRELDHRAKNALAVVQAALRLTPREDAEAFARAVEGRVAADRVRAGGAAMPDSAFFLGRQSWLAGLPLQGGEIRLRIASKPGAQGSCLASLIQPLAKIAPSLAADAAQVAGGGRVQPCRGGGDHPNLAARHGGRGGRLAPGRAALVAALGAEQLLETVVGARQLGDGATVEQPRSVAAGDLAEVVDGPGQVTGAGAVAGHGRDQAVEATLNHGGVLAGLIAQDVSGSMHPAIGALDVRPEGGGALQAAADQPAQPRERRRGAPFSATRSRLSATASSRALSCSPEAASGGRPSSVMALRTAAR